MGTGRAAPRRPVPALDEASIVQAGSEEAGFLSAEPTVLGSTERPESTINLGLVSARAWS
jgi:hypothetical protein